jgi:hypothetical protein
MSANYSVVTGTCTPNTKKCVQDLGSQSHEMKSQQTKSRKIGGM